jgi:hypothetical protein
MIPAAGAGQNFAASTRWMFPTPRWEMICRVNLLNKTCKNAECTQTDALKTGRTGARVWAEGAVHGALPYPSPSATESPPYETKLRTASLIKLRASGFKRGVRGDALDPPLRSIVQHKILSLSLSLWVMHSTR